MECLVRSDSLSSETGIRPSDCPQNKSLSVMGAYRNVILPVPPVSHKPVKNGDFLDE